MVEPTPALLLAASVILLGAVVQGSVGFGVAMVAAPYMMWVLPETVPATLIILGGSMAVTTLVREWRHVDVHDLVVALLGRLPGIAVGTWLLLVAGTQALGVLVGGIVAVAAALQWWKITITRSTPNVAAAGFLSGIAATVSGVGGPPLAMVLAGEAGPRVRATLASFFALGAALSLASLTLTGQVTGTQVAYAAALFPAMLLGALLARPLARYMDSGRTRAAILLLAGISGVVLTTSSLLGA
ncbi:MAG TPA: sulfite exporter TauE/SafE family protein [Propionibacterium sp.]|nr:sulfite exporter TauE/SafE family protein [Propionibacterium sp.]